MLRTPYVASADACAVCHSLFNPDEPAHRADAVELAQGADAATAERCAPAIALVEDRAVRGYLVATQAAAAERREGEFEVLAEMVKDEDAHTRLEALSALEFTDATDLIAPVLVSDPEANLRLMAVGLLAARADEHTWDARAERLLAWMEARA